MIALFCLDLQKDNSRIFFSNVSFLGMFTVMFLFFSIRNPVTSSSRQQQHNKDFNWFLNRSKCALNFAQVVSSQATVTYSTDIWNTVMAFYIFYLNLC